MDAICLSARKVARHTYTLSNVTQGDGLRDVIVGPGDSMQLLIGESIMLYFYEIIRFLLKNSSARVVRIYHLCKYTIGYIVNLPDSQNIRTQYRTPRASTLESSDLEAFIVNFGI